MDRRLRHPRVRQPRRGHQDCLPPPASQRRQDRAASVPGLGRVSPASRSAATLAEVVAAERAALVATLIRLTGDWDLAEDCVQDAIEKALSRWPIDGVPRTPGAWLTTTARNRALDVLRRRRTERAKLQEVALLGAPMDRESADPLDDDRLRL